MIHPAVNLAQLQGWQALWVVAPMLLCGLAMPALVMAIIARASGWKKLAARYPQVDPGPRAGGGSCGSVRFMPGGGYNNCIIWKDDETYLHLRIWPWLGAFHAPLSIPWEAVRVRDAGRSWVAVDIDGVRWSLAPSLLTGELARRALLAEAAT